MVPWTARERVRGSGELRLGGWTKLTSANFGFFADERSLMLLFAFEKKLKKSIETRVYMLNRRHVVVSKIATL